MYVKVYKIKAIKADTSYIEMGQNSNKYFAKY